MPSTENLTRHLWMRVGWCLVLGSDIDIISISTYLRVGEILPTHPMVFKVFWEQMDLQIK